MRGGHDGEAGGFDPITALGIEEGFEVEFVEGAVGDDKDAGREEGGDGGDEEAPELGGGSGGASREGAALVDDGAVVFGGEFGDAGRGDVEGLEMDVAGGGDPDMGAGGREPVGEDGGAGGGGDVAEGGAREAAGEGVGVAGAAGEDAAAAGGFDGEGGVEFAAVDEDGDVVLIGAD